MNWDQIEGKWSQLKGSIKEKWGKLTDDELEEIGGKRDRLAGKLQEKYGYAKEQVEREIDEMNKVLEPLRSFILPGGSQLAAYLHLCRTVARRAERLSVELSGEEEVNPAVVTYLNRLSDWFFVASRVANGNGAQDVLWVPGANR